MFQLWHMFSPVRVLETQSLHSPDTAINDHICFVLCVYTVSHICVLKSDSTIIASQVIASTLYIDIELTTTLHSDINRFNLHIYSS
jgi:hypothetical protein